MVLEQFEFFRNLLTGTIQTQVAQIEQARNVSHEVDFYLLGNRELIQVTQNLNNALTREREIRALQSAIQQLKPESAVILTDANGNDMEIHGVPVMVRSAAEWMLRF